MSIKESVSSLDIKVKEGVDVSALQSEIKSVLGSDFVIKNRFEQQDDLHRMVNMEKWVTFLILGLIMVIAVFNLVRSLTILIIEKNEDIRILKTMGASNNLVIRVFLLEGLLINFVGILIGLVLGLLLCLAQQYFGLLKLGSSPEAFFISAYPVSVQLMDIVLIFVSVSLIGILAVLYPINSLRKRL